MENMVQYIGGAGGRYLGGADQEKQEMQGN